MESFIFLISIIVTSIFLIRWYYKVLNAWPRENKRAVITLLALTPLILLIMFLYTTTTIAASDVVVDPYYIFYYLVLGFLFIVVVNFLLSLILSISWIDDALNNGNIAATLLLVSSLLGLGLIYSGANIGEGPGWWTVVFASGLGVIAFFLLMKLLEKTTNAITRITHDRNIWLSVRISFLVIGISLILAKSSSGNWTSFGHTIIEFFIFWPALVLLLIGIVLENLFKRNTNEIVSIILSLVYIDFALISLFYLTNLFDFVQILGY